MAHRVTILPQNIRITVADGENLLKALRSAGVSPDAPCGGSGTCGKCKVLIDGQEVLACRTAVNGDITVQLPRKGNMQMLGSPETNAALSHGGDLLLAVDIGTTTVAGYLLRGEDGQELACAAIPNPQAAFGADVLTRIRHALQGQQEALTRASRTAVEQLAAQLCEAAETSPAQIKKVCIVGNPAMQQLFLGISPENLARIPFAPVLTKAEIVPANVYIPCCANAELMIIPDISGFVGADTVACVIALNLEKVQTPTLLVDIGTNGEMVLCANGRMVACSTAAGPALEGAGIYQGMTARAGAIDHVWLEDGSFRCSTIGGEPPAGICGSGLIDAVAAALNAGLLNERGKILRDSGTIPLTGGIHLTQEDIRALQLAKGAIAAGISLMARHLSIGLDEIGAVFLAGAFGSYLNPESACRIGLLPQQLLGRITAAGNAAGLGAKMLVSGAASPEDAERLTKHIEFLELAALDAFPRSFANHMRFQP